VIQVDWAEILRFIHRRFRAYPNQKKDHHQWDDVGKFLWDASVARGENTFVNYIRSLLADQQGNRLTVHLPDNVFDKRVED
jgi:hypothetical protein